MKKIFTLLVLLVLVTSFGCSEKESPSGPDDSPDIIFTNTASPTVTQTNIDTVTRTATPQNTATITETYTVSKTITPSPTFTQTGTITKTFSVTQTITATFTATATATITLTSTPLPLSGWIHAPTYLPDDVSYFTVVEYDSKLWLLEKNDVYNSSNGYDWTTVATSVPYGTRSGATSLVFDDGSGEKMWILGGSGGDHQSHDVWNSSNGVDWNLVTGNAFDGGSKVYHSSVVYDNKMWVIGGQGGGSDVYSSTDGANWTLVKTNAEFGSRYYHTSVVYDGAMWLISGFWNNYSYKSDVWKSTDGITWTEVTSDAAAVHNGALGHDSFVHDGKMWTVGGQFSDNSLSNDVWYSEDGALWVRTETSFTGDSQGCAMFGTASFDGGDGLKAWIFGGGKASSGGTFPPSSNIYYSE